MNNLGIYIHIPFCESKCNYCDFYSIKSTKATQEDYITKVIETLSYWKSRLKSNTIVDTIYLGGGTPSILGDDLIKKLLISIADNYTLSENTEITMEANPNSLLNLDINSLCYYGLNRISMGLQSSDDNELKLLGRSHTKDDATNAINAILKSNINNFSLDVITGIPNQTKQTLTDTLDFCIKSGATHISTYMLKVEKGTPFYVNKNNYQFADDDTHADFYELTSKKLTESGFRHYEISNFCKNNMISRHNMKYWLLDDYLGIGPSAHSMLYNKRFYYPNSINEFAPENTVYESEGKTPDEYIMLSLRTDIGFDYARYEKLFNTTPNKSFEKNADLLISAGYLTRDSNSIKLTEKGYPVSNAIISRLMD